MRRLQEWQAIPKRYDFVKACPQILFHYDCPFWCNSGTVWFGTSSPGCLEFPSWMSHWRIMETYKYDKFSRTGLSMPCHSIPFLLRMWNGWENWLQAKLRHVHIVHACYFQGSYTQSVNGTIWQPLEKPMPWNRAIFCSMFVFFTVCSQPPTDQPSFTSARKHKFSPC